MDEHRKASVPRHSGPASNFGGFTERFVALSLGYRGMVATEGRVRRDRQQVQFCISVRLLSL